MDKRVMSLHDDSYMSLNDDWDRVDDDHHEENQEAETEENESLMSTADKKDMDGFSKEEMDILWEAVEPIVAAAECDYHACLRLDKEIKEKHDELEKLKDELQESESERKRLHNRIAELKGNIRVFCRVRPLSSDNEEGSPAIYFPTSLEYRGRTLVLKNGKRFTFDQVFNPEASQEEVYDEISQLVQSALDGYKVCIFAYGQTGSGKSYTMIGSLREKAERGLIPRSLEQIFEATESLVAQGWKYNIQVSMFEIYNETIRDLLSRETGSFSCIDVISIAHVTSLFEQAVSRRVTGMTQMNETSSRSHFIFQIRLLGDNERSGEHVDGALNLIDLAGSERVKKSGVAGDRFKETTAINMSLFCLSQVITALIKKQPVVPYTGSKLTLSLKDCLAAADAKMLMFVNVSPDSSSAAETSSSLEFAEKVNACRIGRHKK